MPAYGTVPYTHYYHYYRLLFIGKADCRTMFVLLIIFIHCLVAGGNNRDSKWFPRVT